MYNRRAMGEPEIRVEVLLCFEQALIKLQLSSILSEFITSFNKLAYIFFFFSIIFTLFKEMWGKCQRDSNQTARVDIF